MCLHLMTFTNSEEIESRFEKSAATAAAAVFVVRFFGSIELCAASD